MAQSYRVESPRSQVHCLLIADDLTGACDAAAPFRAHGASVRVLLNLYGSGMPEGDVLSVSTDSRDLPAADVRASLFNAAATFLPFHPKIVFKKIDSTLRGNPGTEIAAALDAFDCEVAVIAPAFPQMGRHVRAGYLHSDRDAAWQPIPVKTLLHKQGMEECDHISPANLTAALAGASPFISLDTSSDQDLETIVTETLRCRRRVLWAGSAGLAFALARAVFPGGTEISAHERRNAPVLFAVGSNHAVTAGQLNELLNRFHPQPLDADSASSEALASALRSGRHTVLKIGRDTTSPRRLSELFASCSQLTSALLLSGGDTAALVCGAIRAQTISLAGEIVTGLPWGRLDGGSFNNVPVATKSGAFGAPDALIKVAEFFSCLPH